VRTPLVKINICLCFKYPNTGSIDFHMRKLLKNYLYKCISATLEKIMEKVCICIKMSIFYQNGRRRKNLNFLGKIQFFSKICHVFSQYIHSCKTCVFTVRTLAIRTMYIMYKFRYKNKLFWNKYEWYKHNVTKSNKTAINKNYHFHKYIDLTGWPGDWKKIISRHIPDTDFFPDILRVNFH